MEKAYAEVAKLFDALAIIHRGFPSEEKREQLRSAMDSHNWRLAQRIVQIEARHVALWPRTEEPTTNDVPHPADRLAATGPGERLQAYRDCIAELNNYSPHAKAIFGYLIAQCTEIAGCVTLVVGTMNGPDSLSERDRRTLDNLGAALGRLEEITKTLEGNGYIDTRSVKAGMVSAGSFLRSAAESA